MSKKESFSGDPREVHEVWLDGLMWVQAAFMQAWRFENALYEQAAALADAQNRAALNEDVESQQVKSWRRSYDELDPYDPQRPMRVPTWAVSMQVTAELQLLHTAVRNVARAQATLAEPRRPPMSGEDILKAMRDAGEHYDRVNNKAARDLAKFPHINDKAVAFTGKEIWIGGEGGVPLSRINAWLMRVNQALHDSLADAGVPKPPADLMTSQAPGDDELTWPKERLRYHWSLPTVDEQESPSEEVPPEIAESLMELFARKRARDPEV